MSETIRCYRVFVDDIPMADKMTLDSALIFVKGLCNEWCKDSFKVTIEQRQAIINKERTNE